MTTLTQLRELVEQRNQILQQLRHTLPLTEALCLDRDLTETSVKILEMLPEFLSTQPQRDEELVKTAVEAFRKDVDDNLCDMSSDTKLTAAIRVVRAVLAPSLAVVEERMEES